METVWLWLLVEVGAQSVTPKAQRKILNELKRNPRVTAKGLKTSLELANTHVHESTRRKTLIRQGVHGRTPRSKSLLARKYIAAHLKFAEEHLGKPQRYRENFSWTDETKVEWFRKKTRHSVWRKKGTAYQHQNIIPTVKYVGGNINIMGTSCLRAWITWGRGKLIPKFIKIS